MNELAVFDDGPHIVEEDIQNIDIHQIESSLRHDQLFNLLKREGFHESIATARMKEDLSVSRYFPTDKTAVLISGEGVEQDPNSIEPILRNLINGANSSNMPSYLMAEKESKVWMLPAESVYKARMLFMAKVKFGYTWNQLALIGLGESAPKKAGIVGGFERDRILEEEITEMKNQIDHLTSHAYIEEIAKIATMNTLSYVEQKIKQIESPVESMKLLTGGLQESISGATEETIKLKNHVLLLEKMLKEQMVKSAIVEELSTSVRKRSILDIFKKKPSSDPEDLYSAVLKRVMDQIDHE